MNVITIVSDTLRRDYLGPYGNTVVRTPSLDRLARWGTVFERSYIHNFPTVPARLDMFTGRYTAIDFDWSPLPRGENVLAQVLSHAGVLTYLIGDTYNLFRDGYNFDRGFTGFEWIRGNGADRWRTAPHELDLGLDPSLSFDAEGYTKPHFRNASLQRFEEERFTAQTFRAAARWLEENRGQPFYLHVDTFDPHEPWHPPQWYIDLYDRGYTGRNVTQPPYASAALMTAAELTHCRALYAASLTMMDRWLGHLLTTVENLGLLADTAIFFTTDHGFYLGEHGWIGKTRIEGGLQHFRQLYEEVAHVPLIAYLPGTPAGQHSGALVQPVDLAPTVYELMGVSAPTSVQGRSLAPLIRGEDVRLREVTVSGPAMHHPGRWRPSTICDGEWTLIVNGPIASAEQFGEIRAVDGALRSEGRPEVDPAPELYHLPGDPQQQRNVFAERHDVARRLHAAYIRFLERNGLPEDALSPRRELPPPR